MRDTSSTKSFDLIFMICYIWLFLHIQVCTLIKKVLDLQYLENMVLVPRASCLSIGIIGTKGKNSSRDRPAALLLA
jgi:hypothetical protein